MNIFRENFVQGSVIEKNEKGKQRINNFKN